MEINEKGMGACSLTGEQRKVAEDNYGLIYAALKKYCIPREYEDFYGVMAEGLCNAVRTYNPNRGVKFSTYAMKCMWSACFMEKRKRRTQRSGNDVAIVSLSDPVPGTDGRCIEDLVPDGSDFVCAYEQSTLIRKTLDRLARKYELQGKYNGVKVDRMYVFKRACIEGATQNELAEELGVAQGTVSRIARRVKQDLACMLKQEGVETW